MSLNLSALNVADIRDYLMPAGIISSSISAAIPNGWLECLGQSVSRTAYASLFKAIGTTYGSVDANSFTIPDLRGAFVRGLDAGRGIDTGRVLGSAQTDALQDMYGEFNFTNGFSDCVLGSLYTTGVIGVTTGFTSGLADSTTVQNTVGDAIFDASKVARVANETRPHNFAVKFIIKT